MSKCKCALAIAIVGEVLVATCFDKSIPLYFIGCALIGGAVSLAYAAGKADA
jgi:uncharacterized membrane protein